MKLNKKIISIASILVIGAFLLAIPLGFFVKWNDYSDIKSGGPVSASEFSDLFQINLPTGITDIYYLQTRDGIQSYDFYVKMKFSDNVSYENIVKSFKCFYINPLIIKYEESVIQPDEIPTNSSLGWWKPAMVIDGAYFYSQFGYSAPRFWLDKENNIIYMHEGE